MNDFTSAISRVIDNFPGLSDSFSLDLYEWNERAKKARPEEISLLTAEFNDRIFLDCTGGFPTSPVVSERLFLKCRRSNSEGREFCHSLLWNERELICFERLSNQKIAYRVHSLASAILELPHFIEKMIGAFELPIDDVTEEDSEDEEFYLEQLVAMNKLIQTAVSAQQQKAETRQLILSSQEDKRLRLIKIAENENRVAEIKIIAALQTEKKKAEFSSLTRSLTTQLDKERDAHFQKQDLRFHCREKLIKTKEVKLKKEFDIKNQEDEIERIQKEIARLS